MLRRRGPLVAGAVGVGLALIMILLLVLPKMNQVSSAQKELDAAKARQFTLESQLSALQEAKAEAPKAQKTIEDVERQIPPTAQEGSFILLINNAATLAAVQVATLTPGAPTPNATTGLTEIPVAVSTTGTYFSQVEFLYNLETLPRAAKVLDVSLTTSDSTTTGATIPELSMQTSVTLYTTDASAGPGSIPGATASSGTGTTTPGTTPSTTPPA